MSTYQCRDCGHPYGSTPPSAPVIALHRAVSHGGATPIVEITAPNLTLEDVAPLIRAYVDAGNFDGIDVGGHLDMFLPEGIDPDGRTAHECVGYMLGYFHNRTPAE